MALLVQFEEGTNVTCRFRVRHGMLTCCYGTHCATCWPHDQRPQTSVSEPMNRLLGAFSRESAVSMLFVRAKSVRDSTPWQCLTAHKQPPQPASRQLSSTQPCARCLLPQPRVLASLVAASATRVSQQVRHPKHTLRTLSTASSSVDYDGGSSRTFRVKDLPPHIILLRHGQVHIDHRHSLVHA